MVMDDAEFIYDSLTGQYIPEAAAKDVEDAFAPGQPCHALYKEASGAYDRLCDRLGVTDEDEDVEIIFNAFLSMSKILGIKMYHYGLRSVSSD